MHEQLFDRKRVLVLHVFEHPVYDYCSVRNGHFAFLIKVRQILLSEKVISVTLRTSNYDKKPVYDNLLLFVLLARLADSSLSE